jgi:hypothetical protein
MTAIIILNIVFATFVVGGILAVLSRGIVRDRQMVEVLTNRGRHVRPWATQAQARSPRRPSPAGGSRKQVLEVR